VSPPVPPIEVTSSNFSPELKDGLLAGILGGFAMSARMLLSTEPVSWGFVVRRFLAASITAAFVGLATKDYFHSVGLWLACSGGSGYAAPEVTDYLIRWVKAKGEQEISKVRGKTKTNAKQKSKTKTKPAKRK